MTGVYRTLIQFPIEQLALVAIFGEGFQFFIRPNPFSYADFSSCHAQASYLKTEPRQTLSWRSTNLRCSPNTSRRLSDMSSWTACSSRYTSALAPFGTVVSAAFSPTNWFVMSPMEIFSPACNPQPQSACTAAP